MDNIIISGDLNKIRITLSEENFRLDYFILTIENGHLNVLKYLLEKFPKIKCDFFWVDQAIKSNQTEILEYLLQRPGLKMEIKFMWLAAKYNRFDMLKILRENYACPWNDWVADEAIETGNFEMIKYLMENGCPFGSRSRLLAVNTGNMEIVRFVVEKSPYLDLISGTCLTETASKEGYFDVLKYLRTECNLPCPWNKERCLEFAKAEDMKKWILEQN